jgi:hypothetical protein
MGGCAVYGIEQDVRIDNDHGPSAALGEPTRDRVVLELARDL